ncbi:uncharacterized protein LOC128529358 [Clarias gariepinus]|uniref:uncharacterized protein LOC128529358 n=1 Tax=Clarias gariepinus TaxID=13013 RepID=UPI00234DDBE5|nr:uncharacterized protein LOC128529358 [Clarias gariepinus]
MRTLEEIDQLKQSRFGQPQPRHGLKLLYWFANDCLRFKQDNIMLSKCYPQIGDFGFHEFVNRYNRNGTKLLPDEGLTYYEVGNLKETKADDLPYYVRNLHTDHPDNSNMDRLIISANNKWIHSVYVTEHSNLSDFNQQSTYCISNDLIKMIKNMTLDDFLLKTGYSKTNLPSTNPLNAFTDLSNQQTQPPTSNSIPATESSRNENIHIQIDDVETYPSRCNCIIL